MTSLNKSKNSLSSLIWKVKGGAHEIQVGSNAPPPQMKPWLYMHWGISTFGAFIMPSNNTQFTMPSKHWLKSFFVYRNNLTLIHQDPHESFDFMGIPMYSTRMLVANKVHNRSYNVVFYCSTTPKLATILPPALNTATVHVHVYVSITKKLMRPDKSFQSQIMFMHVTCTCNYALSFILISTVLISNVSYLHSGDVSTRFYFIEFSTSYIENPIFVCALKSQAFCIA